MQFDTIILDELSPDSSDYEHDGLALAQNAIPVQSAWREIKGKAQAFRGSVIVGTDRPRGAASDTDGNTSYVGTDTRLYSFDSGGFHDRSKGGVAYAAGGAWNFTKFGSAMIAASDNPAVPLQARIGSAATFVDLVTSVDRPTPQLLGVVRSVVVGANTNNGGAGVYAASGDGQQFVWSARNDATNWQVDGLNGAGFGYLKDSEGVITSLVTFASYALAFKQFGVYRLDYTGDSNGFQPSEIGAGGLGIPQMAWGQSAVKAGGDTFYFGGVGPCVVYNGETCQILGGSKVRRYLSDFLSDYGADPFSPITGAYDPWLGAVIWSIVPQKFAGSLARILVITEIKHGSYDAYTVRFSPQEGRWATIEPGGQITHLTQILGNSIYPPSPLANMRLFGYQAPDTLRVDGFTDTTTSLPITLISKIWHPLASSGAPPGSRQAKLYGVRPIWGIDLHGDALPLVTVVVEWTNDPLFKAGVSSLILDMANHNDDWFLSKANMPLVAGFFRFTVGIPSMASAHLREFHALELAFQPSTEG